MSVEAYALKMLKLKKKNVKAISKHLLRAYYIQDIGPCKWNLDPHKVDSFWLHAYWYNDQASYFEGN